MSLTRMLEYTKPEKEENNKVLLEIARNVINGSPEPRYKIKLRDDVLAMKEKERLGFNFNRSVAVSLRSRWDVVEKATTDYLLEIIDMNDQVEDDSRKYENQLINLIVTRTTNLGLNSRIEQMAGLFMHMNFYCTVLKFKIQHLEPTRAFIYTCSDMMGFSRPSQLIDRYAALQHVFAELYADYDTRQNLLNHLTETLSEIKAETNHRNMLMHNQMAEMHTRIKHLQTESAQLERAILDQMEISTGASLEIYKIKNAVYNIYITMMTYRGFESTQTESFGQLDELEVRITHTQAAVKMLLMEEAKLQSKKKLKKKHETLETSHSVDELYSDSNKSDDDSDEIVPINDNFNVSACGSAPFRRPAFGIPQPKRMRSPERLQLEKLPGHKTVEASNTNQLQLPFPPIRGKDTYSCVSHADSRLDLEFPSLDKSSNKGREHGRVAKPGRGCVSMIESRESLPVIKIARTATVFSEKPAKKDASGTKYAITKSLEFPSCRRNCPGKKDVGGTKYSIRKPQDVTSSRRDCPDKKGV